MDLLRQYLWLWVIIASIFACVVISLIFIFINKCISRQGKHRITKLHRRSSSFTVNSNKYQERSPRANTPPLPPRTQFLTGEAQSYENLAEVPDYEQDKGDYEQAIPDYEQDKGDYEQAIPDYEQDKGDYEQAIPDYEQDKGDYEQAIPDYEQSILDYEQDMAEQFVYVKVEEEEEQIPPPPPPPPHPASDDTSMDDYDDIGGEDENQGDEDYDDVG